MVKLRMMKVFVPGGQPDVTYVQRTKIDVERVLKSASDNLCKLITLTGPTKSGKTVVTTRIYPKDSCVWVDVGATTKEDEFWNQIVDSLDGITDITTTTSKESAAEMGGEVGSEINLGLWKGGGKVAPKYGQKRVAAEIGSRKGVPAAKAVQFLRESKLPLIVDDFHYLARPVQANVVRALKGLVQGGHPVVLLAIPHRKSDAIRAEREMTARVLNISMPPWTAEELRRIPFVGFPALNLKLADGIEDLFLKECLDSPHLMQEFCRQLCEENGVEETLDAPRTIGFKTRPEDLFVRVAKDQSKPIFDRLAKGPISRKSRTDRQFKDGSKGDIYIAVLKAIARLNPSSKPLDYEAIRASLKDILEDLPQLNEINRVLGHMSKLQISDDSSAPVIDWEKDERRLHITDPFFAFFLRWGVRDYESAVIPGSRRV